LKARFVDAGGRRAYGEAQLFGRRHCAEQRLDDAGGDNRSRGRLVVGRPRLSYTAGAAFSPSGNGRRATASTVRDIQRGTRLPTQWWSVRMMAAVYGWSSAPVLPQRRRRKGKA
jgi:hypothetical protein